MVPTGVTRNVVLLKVQAGVQREHTHQAQERGDARNDRYMWKNKLKQYQVHR